MRIKELKLPVLFTLWVIKSHKNNKTGECYPSINRIAELSGVSEKTVDRHIKILKEKGFIGIDCQFDGCGMKHSHYSFKGEESFVIVSTDLMKEPISNDAKCLLILLKCYCIWGTNTVMWSKKTLLKLIKVDKTKFFSLMKELESAGFIKDRTILRTEFFIEPKNV